MASRYLKATGDWDNDNTWSATDGGAAGATYPVAADSVFLTANGNGLTLTLTGAEACASIVASGGCTATMAGTQTLTVGGNVTLLASMTVPNTITWTVTGTGNFAGSTLITLGAINLNGTAHTTSGAFTYTVLTRNGTATTTDTLILTSGITMTGTTFAMIGNSITNRLLVQSSTLGTAATITATNWTGSANCDLMDITVTNAVDLSAITGGSGDCQGNTDITFTTSASQISAAAGNFSTLATWQDGVGTDRVPLPQDDWSCSHNLTIDMLRIGRSVTFTGSPTVTISNFYNIFGSLSIATGISDFTHGANDLFLRGRGSYNLNTNNIRFSRNLYTNAPTSLYTAQSELNIGGFLHIAHGGYDFNGFNVSFSALQPSGASTVRTLRLGSGVITLTSASAETKWNLGGVNLAFDAGTSTIILTNSGTNAQTFAGGGLTYNNIQVAGAGAYALTISGNNNFKSFYTNSQGVAKTITGTAGTTQRIESLYRDPSNAVITLNSTGAAWTLIGNSGYCELDYMDIANVTAAWEGIYYAGDNSTDSGGNTNITFTRKVRPTFKGRGRW